MRIAEQVTFGGSALDRAAHLRGTDQLAEALRTDAKVIVLWRGKLLMQDDGAGKRLVRLPADHAVFADYTGETVFLGVDHGAHSFARDISAWRPDDLDDATLGAFVDQSEQSHPFVDGATFCELRATMAVLSARDAELAATAKAIVGWHMSHRFCAACGSRSISAKSGWQRDCSSCNISHFPRTDPVVIMLITHGNSVLVGRSPGWPEGMYSLLAGFIEPGETIKAAVRREVLEEAGVQVGQVDYLCSQPWAFPSSLMIGCQGEAITEHITIDPEEIEEALWISREEMMLAFSGQHPKVKPARNGAIAQFLLRAWVSDRLD